MALIGLCAAMVPAFSVEAGAEETNGSVILRSVEISTTIDNAYAITEITYNYENTGDEAGEAVFSLSIPEKAFISNFSLTLGNSTYYADVLTRDEARERYDDAVASGNTAGLGEQQDTKHFSFSVNIEGGQTAGATLRYEHHITRFLGERSYELFLSSMSADPESLDLSIDISSASGVTGLTVENYEDEVEEIWESSHKLTIAMEGDGLIYQEDLVIRYTEEGMPENGSLVGYYDSESEEYYFLNVFSPDKSNIGGGFSRDIIFVLDKSGSMGGDKMDQLKQAFLEILDQLPEDDRFGIIMFDDKIELFRSELRVANETNKQHAKEYLNAQTADGSTNLYDGLEKGLEMLAPSEARAPIIVMLTDGKANHGTYTSPFPIREHIREKNTIFCPIFTLGFGTDVDFEFLTALSLENYAKAQQIFLGENAGEQIVNFYDTISTTLLKRISIEYSGGAYDYFPESIPALYEGSENVIVGKLNLTGTGEDNDTLTTSFSAETPEGIREFNATYQVSVNDTDHDAVKRFWSFARIHQLLDELTLTSGEEKDNIISEIEDLSIAAHFVTPYTSLYLEVQQDDEDQGSEDDGGEDDTGGSDPGPTSQSNDPYTSPYDSPQPRGGGSLGVPSDGSDEDGSTDGGFGAPLGGIYTIMAFVIVAIMSLIRSNRNVRKKREK